MASLSRTPPCGATYAGQDSGSRPGRRCGWRTRIPLRFVVVEGSVQSAVAFHQPGRLPGSANRIQRFERLGRNRALNAATTVEGAQCSWRSLAQHPRRMTEASGNDAAPSVHVADVPFAPVGVQPWVRAGPLWPRASANRSEQRYPGPSKCPAGKCFHFFAPRGYTDVAVVVRAEH